jgi:ATP:ADP antiporter, AAA family
LSKHSPNQFWLKLLNVHTHEWGVVRKLFWLQFFQGAGITFFFSAEFPRFLEKFPVSQLPWMMVISAFLLWIAGFIYSKLEHRIAFKPFNTGMILLMAASMLLVRLGSSVFSGDWFDYLSLAWFYVLYLLNNLGFWGIAAQLFDIRQSKRLFGVVSAGEIPAKFFGYSLAFFIVEYTGTLNLLFIGIACMICSIPFFLKIAKSEEKSFDLPHKPHHAGLHHAPKPSMRSIIDNFFSNSIILRIAGISVLATASLIIVNYGFYAKVKEAYHDDVELAKFITFFMAALRIAALVTKTLLTGRLTVNLGVRKSLYILPLVMIVMVAAILVSGTMSANLQLLFYLFGATAIAVDVLKMSINTPVLLAAMQPLPTHERLRAHNIVKGIMDPFATLFCGLLLILLFSIQREINLMTLCYVLLAIGVLWLIGVARVNKLYLNMLVNTISSRFLSQDEFTLNDEQTIQKLKEKITTGSYAEVLSILQMVSSKQNRVSADLLVLFLSHPSAAVRYEAAHLVGSNEINALKPVLNNILLQDQDESVKTAVVRTMAQLSVDPAEQRNFLQHPDQSIRIAAITGMLNSREPGSNALASQHLHNLFTGANADDKAAAFEVLWQVRDNYDFTGHAILINQSQGAIQKKAIDAVGKAASEHTIMALMQAWDANEKPVFKALLRVGENAIPTIFAAIAAEKKSAGKRQQLIRLCGKIGGLPAQQLLLALLQVSAAGQPEIIKALYRCKFSATSKETKAELEELCRAYLKYAVELLQMQKTVRKVEQPGALIYSAVEIELQEIRELLLCLFAIVYDRRQIKKVRNGLNANQRSSIANAMEIIEVTVRKDIGRYFNLIFEDVPIDRKTDALKVLNMNISFNDNTQVLKRILSEQPIDFHNWTKACSLYISKKYQLTIDQHLLHKYLGAESRLLQETASYALA